MPDPDKMQERLVGKKKKRHELHNDIDRLKKEAHQLRDRRDFRKKNELSHEQVDLAIQDTRADKKRKIERRTRIRTEIRVLRRKIVKLASDGEFQPWMANGHPAANLSDEVEGVIVRMVNAGLYITSTSDGGHSSGSYHYYKPCRAVDGAAPMNNEGIARMRAFHAAEMSRYPSSREIFGPGNIGWIKNGVRTRSGTFPNHGNHNHVAPAF